MTVRVRFLGGVGEFGRNCLLIDDEAWGAAVAIDCGMKILDLPDEDGIRRELLFPDFAPLVAAHPRLAGYIITHGHDDHIGGLPAACRKAPAPLYASPFTRRRIRRRFSRDGGSLPELMAVDAGTERQVGPFTVAWTAVSHSIPDSTAVVITTSAGRIVHSGDWRVDDDPLLGPPTDLAGLRARSAGARLLMADSTGARTSGDNPGEQSVRAGLDAAFDGVKGRLYVATFASHIQRIALVAELCRKHRRRLVVAGRGMRDNVHAAEELALLGLDDIVLPERDVFSVPSHLQCVLVTGTQGEKNSALERIANDVHARIEARAGDRAVLSARVIPGNEEAVEDVVAALRERGVDVWDGRDGRHVSGHGYAGDLQKLIDAVAPEAFCPVHGEPGHLDACGALASERGVGTVLRAQNGDEIVVRESGCEVTPASPSS